MDWYRARQQFQATMDDGVTERTVGLGEVLPASHELVRRDLAGAAAAKKDGVDRLPLFELLESSEEEPPKAARRTAKGTS